MKSWPITKISYSLHIFGGSECSMRKHQHKNSLSFLFYYLVNLFIHLYKFRNVKQQLDPFSAPWHLLGQGIQEWGDWKLPRRYTESATRAWHVSWTAHVANAAAQDLVLSLLQTPNLTGAGSPHPSETQPSALFPTSAGGRGLFFPSRVRKSIQGRKKIRWQLFSLYVPSHTRPHYLKPTYLVWSSLTYGPHPPAPSSSCCCSSGSGRAVAHCQQPIMQLWGGASLMQ